MHVINGCLIFNLNEKEIYHVIGMSLKWMIEFNEKLKI